MKLEVVVRMTDYYILLAGIIWIAVQWVHKKILTGKIAEIGDSTAKDDLDEREECTRALAMIKKRVIVGETIFWVGMVLIAEYAVKDLLNQLISP